MKKKQKGRQGVGVNGRGGVQIQYIIFSSRLKNQKKREKFNDVAFFYIKIQRNLSYLFFPNVRNCYFFSRKRKKVKIFEKFENILIDKQISVYFCKVCMQKYVV